MLGLPETIPVGLGPKKIGEHNRSVALMHIRRCGKISRGDLAALMGLSLPSITSIVNGLLETGLIMETDASLARNEPRSLLAIDPDWGCVVCVSLTYNLAVGIVDLAGNTLSLERVAGDDITHFLYRDRFDDLVQDGVRRTLKANRHRRVLGIGVLSGGYVDDAGIIRYNGDLPQRDVDMREVLAPVTRETVCVDEEHRLLLLSKMWSNQWEGWQDAVALNPGGLGYGGGHALALNGRLYYGRRGMAGIGGELLGAPYTSGAGEEMLEAVRCMGGMEEYLRRVGNNDASVRGILDRVIQNYAYRLGQVVTFLSPDVVFVYHPYSDCLPTFMDHVRTAAERPALPLCMEGLDIRFGGRRTDEERMVAAALPVMDRFLFAGGLTGLKSATAGSASVSALAR